MSELADYMVHAAPVEWIVGKVAAVTGDTFTMTWMGGTMYNVGTLDQYTPVVGDIVHCLSWGAQGVIALGSNNGDGSPPTVLPTPVVSSVSAIAFSTYGPDAGLWAPGTLVQSPTTAACFFYNPTVIDAVEDAELSLFEIQINRASGGPAEYRLHNNVTGTGVLNLMDDTVFIGADTTAGVATYVSLPLGWGEAMLTGDAAGIAIGLHMNDGAYNGTGNLRFTTI